MYGFFESLFVDHRAREIFSERGFVARMLRFEAELATVEGTLGLIPAEAVEPIVEACDLENVDFELLERRTEEVGFPLAPLLEQISTAVSGDWQEYLHWGATTQDAMDTALALQMGDTLDLLEDGLDELGARLASMADTHRATVMAGRSQLLHGSPVTFGYKAAVWLDGVQAARTRVIEVGREARTVQLGSAVGTLSALGDDGPGVRAALAERLGLADPRISWHTSRGRVGDAVAALGVMTAALAKIGLDVSLMSQTELAEVVMPIAPGHGISSTMPQKRNLLEPQLMQTAAKAVRQYVAMTLESAVHDHERGTGVWQLEWLAVPEAFLLASGSLHAANRLFASLEPDVEALRSNIDASEGLIMAEAVMMKLAPVTGRTRAHDLVSAAVDRVARSGETLVEAVLADESLTDTATEVRAAIEGLTPEGYLGAIDSMIDAVLAEERRRNLGDR